MGMGLRRIFGTAAIVVVVVSGAFIAYRFQVNHTPPTTAHGQQVSPILIPGIQEPAEMRVEPIPAAVLTPPERMLAEAMQQVGNKGGPAALLPALDRIIAKYPDYSDGYVMRLGALCDGNDRAAILSNVNGALKYVGNSRTGKDSVGSLLSMRAKVEHANGDDTAAMEDLDKAIHSNIADATQFVNSGAVAPEKTASACTWTQPDMDALVQRFPRDYRAYVLQGLYYGFFTEWNQDSLKPALESLRRAGELNTTSALPHFFSAHVLKRGLFIKQLGMSDKQREDFEHALLNELNAALALDPGLSPALADRAEVFFELKQFQQAIPDYDKILAIDAKDSGAYNDRALAKMQIGDNYGAISDFASAIASKKRELQQSSSYEGRADAYLKTQQWDLAIRDLTTAISLQTGGVVLLINIKQFRALYPEYKAAPDEAVARKLNQTFFPNMKYEDFSKQFLRENGPWSSTVIPDLYVKRSDAYLKAGDWHSSAIEFRRALDGFPGYSDAIDRWREIGSQRDSHVYLDMKTFDDARRDSAKLWIKQSTGSEDVPAPHSVQQFELNCASRQIHVVSFTNYDEAGNVIGSREGEKWQSVVPDTLGEMLFNGVCKSN